MISNNLILIQHLKRQQQFYIIYLFTFCFMRKIKFFLKKRNFDTEILRKLMSSLTAVKDCANHFTLKDIFF